ncbi:MAG: M20/M25/M40 family metallo-hydrolase [Lachnospiraceae bacterium]|nr:M20/M25/M40 family metallo-hydrolase [Lachnospiraceae bacterium]
MTDYPNTNRIVDEFTELTSIDSVSFKERVFADVLKEKLKALGFDFFEDEAGDAYGGNAGNIYAFLEGNSDAEPILLSSHMDTVQPGIGKKPIVRDDGRITSDGTTVLGADDVAGIVEILEGIRIIKESGVPHRSIELLFPIGEEEYIKGTDVFDFSKIKSKDAYVLDMSGKVGSAAIKAPSIISFEVVVKGKASHAGFHPDEGINAIQAMAYVVSSVSQGRIDEETTLNIGTISGGTATNIISEQCVCTGEIRSYVHKKALAQLDKLKAAFEEAKNKYGIDYEFKTDINMKAYEIDKSSSVVSRFENVCSKLNLPGNLTETFGGSDNNNFVKNGISGIVLSCGMYNVHSKAEYTTIEDLEKGSKLVAELILAE